MEGVNGRRRVYMSIIKKRLIPLVIVAVCLTAGVVFAQSIPKEQVQGLPAAIAQIVLLQQQVAAQQLQINDLQAQLAAIGDPDEIASLVKRTQYFDVDEVKKVTYWTVTSLWEGRTLVITPSMATTTL
jgi:cell division protein FtsL